MDGTIWNSTEYSSQWLLLELFSFCLFCFLSRLKTTCPKHCTSAVRLWDCVIWHPMGIKGNLRYGRTTRDQRKLECSCQTERGILQPTLEDCKSQNGRSGKHCLPFHISHYLQGVISFILHSRCWRMTLASAEAESALFSCTPDNFT